MTTVRQRCPSCETQFTTRQGNELAEPCPACGQAAIAMTASVPLQCSPARTEFGSRYDALAEAQVVPEAGNCVQCGMCSYNCPMEIDVRAHAWRGLPIRDSHCVTCSECVKRCPRAVLRFERLPLFRLQ